MTSSTESSLPDNAAPGAGKGDRWRKVLSAAAFLTLVLVLLFVSGNVLKPVNRESLSSTYYRIAPQGMDVLYCGNSIVMNSVYPMELYEQYGYAGYNLGTGGQSFLESYYLIEEGIRRFAPKLVVLDVTQLIVDEPVQKMSFVHYLTDNMPFLTRSRLSLIADLANRMNYSMGEILELVFPVTVYHSRLFGSEKLSLPKDPKEYTAGAKLSKRVLKEIRPLAEHQADPDAVFDAFSVHVLREIIELCQRTGTEICLMSVPLQSMSQEGYNRRIDATGFASSLAREYGIEMFNMIASADELGLDRAKDSADGIHMNISGALKFTSALGAFIRDHYAIPDRRGEYAHMDELDEAYRAVREQYVGE